MNVDDDINLAVEHLRRGGVILYPTDTVWGIGCDASLPEAVLRVFAIKQRSDAKALISLVADMDMLERSVGTIPDAAAAILAVADKPVSIVYDSPSGLAPQLLASDGSAALRITSEPVSREICRRLGRPVVSTSANFSGQPTPRSFSEISPILLNLVDYVCSSGREYSSATPSSVIKVDAHSRITVIRP